MANGQFDQLFQTCVAQEGQAYLSARDAIRAMGDAAVLALEAHAASADWRERLVAQILLGWLRQGALFEQVGQVVRDEQPDDEGLKPIGGMLSAAKKALVLDSFGGAIVPRLLELLLKTKEFQLQNELDTIYTALSDLKSAEIVEPLIQVATQATDFRNQMLVLHVLGETQDPRAYDLAQSTLASAKNAAVRRSAALALGMIGDRRATPALLALAQNQAADPSVRADAIRALGELGDPSASAPLVALLQAEGQTLGAAVSSSLGKLGDRSVVAALEGIEQTHPDVTVRQAAQEARRSLIA